MWNIPVPKYINQIQDGMNRVTLWCGTGNRSPVADSFSRIGYNFNVWDPVRRQQSKSTVGIRAQLWPLLGTGRYNHIS